MMHAGTDHAHSSFTHPPHRRRRSRRDGRAVTGRLSLQERRRVRQRHGNGDRRQRALRLGTAAGRLHGLRGRTDPGRLAFQQRSRAGQPRYRPRCERQHVSGEACGCDGGDRATDLQAARPGRRAVLRGVRDAGGGHAGLDDRSAVDQPGAEEGRPHRRHCALRRRRRVASDWPRRDAIRRRRCSSSPMGTIRTARSTSARCGRRIRESEVLVYALGVDSTSRDTSRVVQPPVQFPPSHSLSIPGRTPPQPRYPPMAVAVGRRRGRAVLANASTQTRCARSRTTPGAARRSCAVSKVSTTPRLASLTS